MGNTADEFVDVSLGKPEIKEDSAPSVYQADHLNLPFSLRPPPPREWVRQFEQSLREVTRGSSRPFTASVYQSKLEVGVEAERLDEILDLIAEMVTATSHWMREEELPARSRRELEENDRKARRQELVDEARRRLDERYGPSG